MEIESVEFDELTDQLVEYGMMSSDKASHNTGGFRISNKDADAAKARLKAKSAVKLNQPQPMAKRKNWKRVLHRIHLTSIKHIKMRRRREKLTVPP